MQLEDWGPQKDRASGRTAYAVICSRKRGGGGEVLRRVVRMRYWTVAGGLGASSCMALYYWECCPGEETSTALTVQDKHCSVAIYDCRRLGLHLECPCE